MISEIVRLSIVDTVPRAVALSGDQRLTLELAGPQGAAGAGYGGTSTTSLAIGTGTKTFATQAGLAYVAGQRVRASAGTSLWMEGDIVSYAGTSMQINVTRFSGSGTFAAWTIGVAGFAGPFQFADVTGLDAALSLASGATYNSRLRRAWTKCAAILAGTPSERLNIVMLGDSLSQVIREAVCHRLKVEYGNGGQAGRLQAETGFTPLSGSNATVVQTVTGAGDYTYSPIGEYWDIAAGGSQSWIAGASSGTNEFPMLPYFPEVYAAPDNCTRVGIYYTRRPGGGTFKVQISTKGTGSGTFTDVAGLTTIDSNGTLGLQYAEATIAATDIYAIKVAHVSGSNCYVTGALVGADSGVYTHAWHIGSASLTNVVNAARFTELAALVPADMVMTIFIDQLSDTPLTTGLTSAQLVDGIMNGIRSAFPATIVPASTAPWAGKTALQAEKPHFVYFGPDFIEAPGATLDQPAQTAAMLANANANGDTFVDTQAVWGSWQRAWNMGVMSGQDSNGGSQHPRQRFWAGVASSFLNECRLIGGAFMKPIPVQRIDKLRVGPTDFAQSNPKNRAKFSDGISKVSLAPMDVTGFGDIAMAIESSATSFECGIFLRSTAVSGRDYVVTHQPGAGFILRDITGSRNFLQYNAAQQLALGSNSGDTVFIGGKGQYLSGIKHGSVALTAGQATVSITGLTANARISLTRMTRGGTVGATYEYVAAAGSFTITSRTSADAVAASDTSTIAYVIVEP